MGSTEIETYNFQNQEITGKDTICLKRLKLKEKQDK